MKHEYGSSSTAWNLDELNPFYMNKRNVLLWILRLVPAIILLQTLYFKFTAHPQSVKLFTTIGLEPYGRIGTGVLEGIAAILILIPRFTGYGALLGLMMMTGALYFHLTKLGIYFDGDPVLFIYALITFACCAILILLNKHQLEQALKRK
ncbi:MAG TPA: DoxX family protein [Puia sp.]